MEEIIRFDKTHYPIVVILTTKQQLSEQDMNQYISQMTEFYIENKGKNVVVIYDISILESIDAKGRIKIGEWLEKESKTIKDAVAGVCYVQKNILQKFILKGIFIVKNPEWPHKVVSTVQEGIEWGKSLSTEKNNHR